MIFERTIEYIIVDSPYTSYSLYFRMAVPQDREVVASGLRRPIQAKLKWVSVNGGPQKRLQ